MTEEGAEPFFAQALATALKNAAEVGRIALSSDKLLYLMRDGKIGECQFT